MKKLEKYLLPMVAGTTLTVVLLGNLIWIMYNNVTPFYDAAGHTNLSYIYANVVRGVFENTAGFLGLQISTYYPPLLYMVSSLINVFVGFDYKYLQYFSLTFLILAALTLYIFNSSLQRNKKAGFVAMTIFVLLPHIWEQSRQFMLDVPLTAFLLGAWSSLYAYEKKRKYIYILSFALFATFAQLTKWYAVMYLFVPFIATVFNLYQKNYFSRISKILVAIVPLLVAAAIVLPWYLVNFDSLRESSVLFSQADFGDPEVLLSLRNILYYPIVVLNYQIISLMFVWLVISFILVRKKKFRWKKTIFGTIIFAYIVFTFFVGNKNLRYIMPLLPLLVIVMERGIAVINKKYSPAVYYLLCGFGVFFFVVSSFVNHNLPVFSTSLFRNVDKVTLFDATSQQTPYLWKSSKEIQREIVSDLSQGEIWPPKKILVISNSPDLSVAGIQIHSLPEQFQSHFLEFYEVPMSRVQTINTIQQIEEFLQPYQYVIVPQENVGPVGQLNYENMENLRKHVLSGTTREYALRDIYYVDSNEMVYLFEKDPVYNQLTVSIIGETMYISRPNNATRVYLQFHYEKDYWIQEYIDAHKNYYEVNISRVDNIRIDYPVELINFESNDVWKFDKEMGFTKVTI